MRVKCTDGVCNVGSEVEMRLSHSPKGRGPTVQLPFSKAAFELWAGGPARANVETAKAEIKLEVVKMGIYLDINVAFWVANYWVVDSEAALRRAESVLERESDPDFASTSHMIAHGHPVLTEPGLDLVERLLNCSAWLDPTVLAKQVKQAEVHTEDAALGRVLHLDIDDELPGARLAAALPQVPDVDAVRVQLDPDNAVQVHVATSVLTAAAQLPEQVQLAVVLHASAAKLARASSTNSKSVGRVVSLIDQARARLCIFESRHIHFRPTALSKISAALQKCARLHTVKMDWSELGAAGVGTLAQHLASHESLRSLSLHAALPQEVHEAADSIGSFTQLTSLDIGNNCIGAAGSHDVAEIGKAICSLKGLQSVKFCNNLLAEMGVAVLGSQLADLPHLTRLDLTGVQLESARDQFGFQFEGLASIEVLRIGMQGRRGHGWASQVGFLPKLKDLDISHTSSACALTILQDMSNTTLQQLTALRCAFNGFGGGFAQRFAGCLSNMRALRVLDVTSCKLDAAAAKVLATQLRQLTAMQHLDLAYNKFGCDGIAALAPALQQMPSLQKLDLFSCTLGNKGTEKLASALRTATSLTMLSLRDNAMHMTALLELSEALKRMTALRQLWLQENKLPDVLARPLLAECVPLECAIELGMQRGDVGLDALYGGDSDDDEDGFDEVEDDEDDSGDEWQTEDEEDYAYGGPID